MISLRTRLSLAGNSVIFILFFDFRPRGYRLSKLAQFLGGKSANELIHSLWNFEFLIPRRAKKYSIHRAQIVVYPFNIQDFRFCHSIRNRIIYAIDVNIVTKDSHNYRTVTFIGIMRYSLVFIFSLCLVLQLIYKPSAERQELQKKMSSLLEKQKRKGGLIDVEQERNKFWLT